MLLSYIILKQRITVTDWACLTTGIQLNYVYDGHEYTLIASEEQSANLLKAIGAIDDYIVQPDRVDVLVHSEDGYSAHCMEFGAFALHFDLSQADALRIAVIHEDQKQINKWADNFRSIPSMVARIGTACLLLAVVSCSPRFCQPSKGSADYAWKVKAVHGNSVQLVRYDHGVRVTSSITFECIPDSITKGKTVVL